jgi:hypothetical protein
MVYVLVKAYNMVYPRFATEVIFLSKDYRFNLQIENTYEKLLNAQNIKQVKGMLVWRLYQKIRIHQAVQIPKNGDRIEVHGAGRN